MHFLSLPCELHTLCQFRSFIVRYLIKYGEEQCVYVLESIGFPKRRFGISTLRSVIPQKNANLEETKTCHCLAWGEGTYGDWEQSSTHSSLQQYKKWSILLLWLLLGTERRSSIPCPSTLPTERSRLIDKRMRKAWCSIASTCLCTMYSTATT